MDVFEKLKILSAAAKFDAACTSSGVDRVAPADGLGSAAACGICHSFAGDGRCISLLKILMSNACTYDCEYCANRKTNDIPRATFTPREIAEITVNFYKRNYIEGLFLSSGVLGTPDRTLELMTEAIRLLREEYKFYGYIHAKVIPGSDKLAIENLGRLCDRMSVNIELPSNESLSKLAPLKSKDSIFTPMGYIKERIENDRNLYLGNRKTVQPNFGGAGGSLLLPSGNGNDGDANSGGAEYGGLTTCSGTNRGLAEYKYKEKFAPAGQSTQMIIGASPESDLAILRLTEALYKKYKLKRVFFSAYIPVVDSPLLPALDTKPPLLRENRLYQADWLMRFYGFEASEILDEKNPTFNPFLDPKCNWAVNHPEFFPVEINKAPYSMLLRVPGIGVLSAKKIVRARRTGTLSFADLKKLGVVLKRAKYFILCSNKPMSGVSIKPESVIMSLLSKSAAERLTDTKYCAQISMFENTVQDDEIRKCITGQL